MADVDPVAGGWKVTFTPLLNSGPPFNLNLLLGLQDNVKNKITCVEDPALSGSYLLGGGGITLNFSKPNSTNGSATIAYNLSGSYTSDTMSGTYEVDTFSDKPPYNNLSIGHGTFTAVRTSGPPPPPPITSTVTVAGAEKYTRSISLVKDPEGGKTKIVAKNDVGVFTLLATVPIPDDFDLSVITSSSIFTLSIGKLDLRFLLSDAGYLKGGTKVHFEEGTYTVPIFGLRLPTGGTITTYDLDWSKGKTLKVTIHSGYRAPILPDPGKPEGRWIFAQPYVLQESGKQFIGSAPFTVSLGRLQAATFVAAIVATQSQEVKTDSGTDTKAKVKVVIATPKAK